MNECTVDGCTTETLARGLCRRHYNHWRIGKVIPGYDQPPKCVDKCSVENCAESAIRQGLCNAHYQRHLLGADMDTPVRMALRGVSMETRLRTYAPVGESDDCWEWTRQLSNKGYGWITVNGKKRSAHVEAWKLHNRSSVPKGMMIRHTCDNPPCTNPAHLLLGTFADNMADKMARNRQSKGEAVGTSKLTESQVLEIRALAESGMVQTHIAARFETTPANITCIVRRRTWKHI